MTTLRVKFGAIELDYEGDLQFEKADVFGLLEAISKLSIPSAAFGRRWANGDADVEAEATAVGSVSDIAHRLEADSGPGLIVAAAAALHFLGKKAEFTNKDLLSTMRDAKAYFKASYASNFVAQLSRLVKNNELRSLGSERYALSAGTIQDLKGRLA